MTHDFPTGDRGRELDKTYDGHPSSEMVVVPGPQALQYTVQVELFTGEVGPVPGQRVAPSSCSAVESRA